MTGDLRTSPGTAQLAPPADTLTALVGALAEVLRLKPERIDPYQTFRSMGFDSILTVEFVATVNAMYGTRIEPSALFDHPTPPAFARHVTRELDAAPGAAVSRPPAPHAQVWEPAADVAPPSTAGEVLDDLRGELGSILCCDPWDIDTSVPLPLLGIDSILGAEFAAVINRKYGTHERAVTLYNHPHLEAVAGHVAAHVAAVARPAAFLRPAAAMGLEALLDAVEEDRMSVDEALTLLPRASELEKPR
ncbi:phosphopantetheine-binding protein [Streptomyces sp. NPDC005283]|uniref:phosphopantetheine-binding protein n=1 Tax=Streptomyces sp. NPDC005283 TaxID=3156871 RepID=UPI0034560705